MLRSVVDYASVWIYNTPRKLMEFVICFPASALNTVVKVGASALTIIPGVGKSSVANYACNGFSRNFKTEYLLKTPYLFVGHLINPFMSYGRSESVTCRLSFIGKFAISCFEKGYEKLSAGEICFEEEEWDEEAFASAGPTLKDKVIARGCFLVGTVAITVDKVIQVAQGIVLAGISLIPPFFATDKKLNAMAKAYLKSIDVIDYALEGLRLTLNPNQSQRALVYLSRTAVEQASATPYQKK